MATTYILDPSGKVKKINTQQGVASDTGANVDDGVDITELSKEKGDSQTVDVVSNDYLATNIVTDDFIGGTSLDGELKDLIFNEVDNSSAFGFIDENGTNTSTKRDSFKPMFHFSDDGNYFATEFEMLTGFTLDGDVQPLRETLFLFDYIIEAIAMLGTAEAITSANQTLQVFSLNETSTVEKFSLRFGQYSIHSYDIYTRYIFNVINYPKDHSDITTRIMSYFVGLAEWLNTDGLIDINKIIEEAYQSKSGSKQIENYIDAFSVDVLKNKNFGLSALAYIGLPIVDTLINSLQTNSTRKRLMLLIKKFRQEKAWSDQLYKAKKSEEDFFVKMDYYYFRFAVERMHIGLKLLNRYGFRKTYLDPSKKESPLTRVSGNKTKNKNNSTIQYKQTGLTSSASTNFGDPLTQLSTVAQSFVNLFLPNDNGEYSWSANKSDSSGHLPGSTTRVRALPQLLNLSHEFVKALALNTNPDANANSVASYNDHFEPSIAQNFYAKKQNNMLNRIPSELVKEIEDHLESEYVPFYLHDVRTNEILSFHAFIDSISDSFNPEYTSASGFGRIDDVKSYVKTTRNINIGFTIAATSEVDHDQMWYQINKLVTMVYPQWSEGHFADVGNEQNIFMYPFTQVPTASPLVRLRLGDVIKNNYSRSSLSRIFGIEQQFNKTDKTGKFKLDKDMVMSAVPNFIQETVMEFELLPGLYAVTTTGTEFFPLKQSYYNVTSPVVVTGPETDEDTKQIKGKSIVVTMLEDPKISLLVDTSKLIKKHKAMASTENLGTVANNERGIIQTSALALMDPYTTDGKKFNNPITAAYESGMSRGIAGFITQLDINYNESTWETSRIGSKAPMLVKVTMNFSPIHDIPLGIDHTGMMRAPAYNVGRVNNGFFGDSHDKQHIGSGLENANKIKSSYEKE